MDAKLFAGAEWWMQDYAALRLGAHDGDLTLGAASRWIPGDSITLTPTKLLAKLIESQLQNNSNLS